MGVYRKPHVRIEHSLSFPSYLVALNPASPRVFRFAQLPAGLHSASKMTPEYCELDAEGDVILILERCHEKDDVQPAAKKAVSGECESKSQIQSEQIRMRVSSKHLTLASNVFRTLFRGSFQEGVTLRTKGTVEIPLPDDHPTALLILLNIVHGHTRRVPRQVDFRMLTQIAILVDKYQCHEAVEMFTDSWCQRVAGAMPQSFTDDLMPAVCVYWVFGQPAEFKHVTQLAQTESKSAISEKVLPIPSRIIGNSQKWMNAF